MEFNNWNGQTFSEYVGELIGECQNFLEFCNAGNERYYADKDVETEMLKKQNDLLHDIELEDLTYHGIARIGKAIRELRRNRRGYKNDYLMNEPVKLLAKDQEKMKIINDFIEILTNLKSELTEKETFIMSQKYNQRSKIEDIVGMKREESDEESNRRNEDLIMLNRVLNKYSLNVESMFDPKDECLIYAKLQLDTHFALKGGVAYLNTLSENIEKYFKPSGKSISCTITISDMCTVDDFKRNLLTGIVSVYIDTDIFYKIHITIRSGKTDKLASKSKKGKKKGKKRK